MFTVADGDVFGLLSAFDAANNQDCFPGIDTITLATNGTYMLTAPTIDGSGIPFISDDVIVEGNNAIIEREVTAPNFGFVHVLPNVNATLKDLTLTGGKTVGADDGTAVFNEGTVNLINMIISNNTTEDDGAGILNDTNATMTVQNSQIMNNTSGDRGAGIISFTGATLIVADTIISNNVSQTDYGGGCIHF